MELAPWFSVVVNRELASQLPLNAAPNSMRELQLAGPTRGREVQLWQYLERLSHFFRFCAKTSSPLQRVTHCLSNHSLTKALKNQHQQDKSFHMLPTLQNGSR